MKFIYTKHAEDKLQEAEAKKLLITKSKLQKTIVKPKLVQDLQFVKRAIGKLDKTHELCVIYKLDNSAAKIIKFFPAVEGRYEKKKN